MIEIAYTRTDSVSAVEPCTLAEVKNYIKENYGTNATEDTLITDMITAARKFIENECSISLALQTVVYWVNDDEEDIREVRLPFLPLNTITSVVRREYDGTETALTLNSDYYAIGIQGEILTLNKQWSTGFIVRNPIFITYSAGYASAASMPKDLKLATMKLVSENYVNRDASVDWGINIVPYGVTSILQHHKMMDF